MSNFIWRDPFTGSVICDLGLPIVGTHPTYSTIKFKVKIRISGLVVVPLDAGGNPKPGWSPPAATGELDRGDSIFNGTSHHSQSFSISSSHGSERDGLIQTTWSLDWTGTVATIRRFNHGFGLRVVADDEIYLRTNGLVCTTSVVVSNNSNKYSIGVDISGDGPHSAHGDISAGSTETIYSYSRHFSGVETRFPGEQLSFSHGAHG